MNRNHKYSAVRHKIPVETIRWDFVSSHTGRDITHVCFFYPSLIPNGISAVRHKIWVETIKWNFVSSHTGRDIPHVRFFYPSVIPNGIVANVISDNFKEMVI
jgi:hypothetical protein